MTKWVVAMVITIFATGNSFPIFFTDQYYRSLEQLDEALANGEITQEYYDEAVEMYIGLDGDITIGFGEMASPKYWKPRKMLNSHGYQFRYETNLTQDLVGNHDVVRYDNLSFKSRRHQFQMSLESRNGHSSVVRSRRLLLVSHGFRAALGNFTVRYGSGVTVGNSRAMSSLGASEFVETLKYPAKSRENGISLLAYRGKSNVGLFVSRLEGKGYIRESAGLDINSNSRRFYPGATYLFQRLGNRYGGKRLIHYLAPHFVYSFSVFSDLSGESSFQVGGASAHYYRLFTNYSESYHEVAFFSYSRDYKNLQSNGYAYSDYEEVSIDELDFTYRDKRPGRFGIVALSRFNASGNIAVEPFLARWENRSANRQCFAAKLGFETSFSRLGRSELRVQVIYQNLDIEHDTDTRKVISVTTKLMKSGVFIYENHHKIEQRVLESSKKYPFRSRHDFTWKITDGLESIAMINYYDSDLNSSDDNQLTFAVGQEIDTGRDLRFAGRVQTRYRFATQRLDNWELRINFEVII